mmetsp:Transcript_69460/g.115402  ORF Transcript_69460/g.115402 Transcript_69460/m.115402 type:complete len:526 (+) Transcript_69460:51-1628(+)
MGGNSSRLSFDLAMQQQNTCAIALTGFSKLRVIHPLPGLVDAITRACSTYPAGISKIKPLSEKHPDNGVDLLFNGSPWFPNQDANFVHTRLLMCSVLREANALGHFLVASDSLQGCASGSTLFYAVSDMKRESICEAGAFVCLATASTNILRLVLGVESNAKLEAAVDDAIREVWPTSNPVDKSDFHGSVQWTFRAVKLWNGAKEEEEVLMHQLVCALLHRFHTAGYVLHASLDLNEANYRDSDSLFFRYDKGLDTSKPVPQYCCLATGSNNKLRCVGVPTETEAALRKAAEAEWPYGCKSICMIAGHSEFTLGGSPWEAAGEADSQSLVLHDKSGANCCATRQLMSKLLEAMAEAGWCGVGTAALVRKQSSKSSWFFSRVSNGCHISKPLPLNGLLCIALSEPSYVRVIGGNERTRASAIAAVRTAAQAYAPGIGMESEKEPFYDHPVFRLSLKGGAWHPDGAKELWSRSFLCHLALELKRAKMLPIASADVNARQTSDRAALAGLEGGNRSTDRHSWWCAELT